MTQEYKTCSSCKEIKLKSDFWKRTDRPNGYRSKCIVCSSKSHSEWHADNKYFVRRRNACRIYSISRETYDAMHSGGCEACGSMENLCVDHDHSCCDGEFSCGRCVRGMLCKGCNVAEGWLDSNPDRARKLAVYMEKFL